ncbi:hypothetical protein ZIOFF_071274 [Zingiber officinale]|uniref:Uncharacterized protein n=1 Tax=Zingiber officinale TaxID=94328 RepID=A0A8J5C831_ZINOF|nr:hypothetical protein ZIOFF_071274 [Zingiber officinale]
MQSSNVSFRQHLSRLRCIQQLFLTGSNIFDCDLLVITLNLSYCDEEWELGLRFLLWSKIKWERDGDGSPEREGEGSLVLAVNRLHHVAWPGRQSSMRERLTVGNLGHSDEIGRNEGCASGGLVVTSEALPPPWVVVCPNVSLTLPCCSNWFSGGHGAAPSDHWVLGLKIHLQVKCEGFRAGLRALIHGKLL